MALYLLQRSAMTQSIDLYALSARLLMLGAMYVLMRTFSRWPYVSALLWFPGTFAHEMAHLVVGILFRAKPVGVSLWPRRIPGTNHFILGHVAFANLNWWKKLPVATAPLLLLFPLGCWIVLDSLQVTGVVPREMSAILIYCFVALQCFVGAWPSPQDWALARPALYVLMGLFLAGWVSYFALSGFINF